MSSLIDAGADSALADDLLDIVRRAHEPIAASKVRSALPGKRKPSPAEVDRWLGELVDAGRIHRLMPTKGKSASYWVEPIDAFARRLILAALDDGPLTPAQLKAKLKPAAKFAAATRLDQVRKGLLTEGLVFEHPKPKGRGAGKFGVRPPDPGDYLDEPLAVFRKALDALAKKLGPVGVDRGRIDAAALDRVRREFAEPAAQPGPAEVAPTLPPAESQPAGPGSEQTDLGPMILERMVELVPAAIGGASVSLRDLRRSMEFLVPAPAAFDAAVLRLADDGLVDLHRYDFPAGLSDAERAELVADGRGGFYIGISRRGD